MKKYIILVLIALLIGALTVGVMGKAKVAHLYLYEKVDDASCDWPVLDGAWGKMKYNTEGTEFEFVFNGHGLDADVEYTLIYYPDYAGNPWPRTGIICLGSGFANGGGEVHIAGSCDTGDLPASNDLNATPGAGCFAVAGAKIWLLPSTDVDCDGDGNGTMTVWNHEVEGYIYLFEDELINFADTDD